MISVDGTVRTDEMSFAAILAIHGYAPVMERSSDNLVEWVIPADEMDEFAADLVDEFNRGACRVEPRRYMREIWQVRQDMYKFLGIFERRSPVRRSVAG